jgi:hypothetical protein
MNLNSGKSSDELDQIKNEEFKRVPLRSKSFRHPVNRSNKTEVRISELFFLKHKYLSLSNSLATKNTK